MLTAVTKEPLLPCNAALAATAATVDGIMPPHSNKAHWMKTSDEYV